MIYYYMNIIHAELLVLVATVDARLKFSFRVVDQKPDCKKYRLII